MKRLSGIFSSPKTTFQVLSDLHLNHDSQYLTFHIPVTSPYLILAGNIGRLIDYESYLSFLIRRCNLYERVFFVLGSLEFHGLAIPDGLELARKLEQEDRLKGRLILLDKRRVDVPDTEISLLGCTLWSNIPEDAESAVLKKVPEFDKAQGIRDWSIKSHNAAYVTDLAWLLSEVKRNTSSSTTTRTLVVVTSFAPELREALPPWQVGSPWCSAYGTELLRGIDWAGVKVWLCGSTGRTGEFKKYGVKVVSNQRGCVGEEEKGLLRDGLAEKEKRGLFDVTKVIKV
ncbi:ser/Thr protein phosphatase superfamily [Lindgomyces ingoldianus]|uniref:Ser/Thr protein phosphatase superfamily n=1 Tax=Lindgomyces ingoldianus TaxID=673940 RepID=A0ACB6QDP1_9PLEO|nr:ser/Thr protein phosphatase superfamily [Lindgomyces ingoldianus]KAF2464487.1 ser/Thr protein phosphatase superfamily [Lindgomyces ingoldianus]